MKSIGDSVKRVYFICVMHVVEWHYAEKRCSEDLLNDSDVNYGMLSNLVSNDDSATKSSWYSCWFCARKAAHPIYLVYGYRSRESPQWLCHKRFDTPSHDSMSIAAAWPSSAYPHGANQLLHIWPWGADNSVIVLIDQLFKERSFFCLPFLLVWSFFPAPYPHFPLPPLSSFFFHLLHHNLIRYLISWETGLARR